MSTLINEKVERISSNILFTILPKNNNHYCRHVLKPKNIFKHKCCKELRRKLKKYKLRKDGKEDEDVLDVSQHLLLKLKIKSPTKSVLKSPNIEQQPIPRNYLFKMARRKHKQKADSLNNSKSPSDIKSSSINNEATTKKPTNAFQLMMDSRNKSIGSNSPGKEKIVDPNEIQELIDKKNTKVKRNLALQEMAEAKGALKNKEMEEYQEECVKRKMEKRAERLKNMIKNTTKTVNDTKATVPKKKTKTQSIQTALVSIDNKSNSITLVDLFEQDDVENFCERKKQLSKDDEEFINKLSPSIKKKENMLCYFNKVEKSADSIIDLDNDESEGKTTVIKVKLTPRRSKKTKSRKLSLHKKTSSEVLKNSYNESKLNSQLESTNVDEVATKVNNQLVTKNNDGSISKTSLKNDDLVISNETRKRKRNNIIAKILHTHETVEIKNENNDERPKRLVKKPAKYFDDLLSSSDEEPHIFTPKKRKQVETKSKKSKSDLIIDLSDDNESKSFENGNSDDKAGKSKKKATKLAPIFSSKPHLTSAEMEAKQKFLHSGIPEQLKKIISQQKKEDTEYNNVFPIVVHIQQNNCQLNQYSKMPQYAEDYSDSEIEITQENSFFKKCMNTNIEETFTFSTSMKQDPLEMLQQIKVAYPQFPVNRTYRLLKDKSKGEGKDALYLNVDDSIESVNFTTDHDVKENPASLSWTDKYKATSSGNLIGNFESIKELKKWLVSWTENQMRRKGNSSDSSDFYDSDSNSRNTLKATDNLLLIHGPTGSGKTSSVYAVAAELAIKVIEVNASNRRTGKLMLQDLQEATQSHKVNRGNSNSENSQKSQEPKDVFVLKTVKKRGRPKKLSEKVVKNVELSQPSNSQEVGRTAMSLILIDDADIVFEQDDGFSSAIGQLTQSSKRPVILVTSSLTCPHLQRYVQYGRVLKMQPFLPKMLGTWLDIMCLADIGNCWLGLGAKFLNYYKGDIRKTINSMQFYLNSQSEFQSEDNSPLQSGDTYKINIDDENSSISWAERDVAEDKALVTKETSCDDNIFDMLIGKQAILTSNYPLQTFDIWWSIPELLSETVQSKCSDENNANVDVIDDNNSKKLDAMFKVFDSLSVADSFDVVKYSRIKNHLTSQPWLVFETDSVSEEDNLQSYSRSCEDQRVILQDYVAGSILQAQNNLQIERKLDIKCPGMAVEREKLRVTSRHENITDYLPSTAVLDRRGLALDYWSACRTICKSQKTNTNTVSKRNNRFLHYLKCLNPVCKNETFNKLGDSLCPGEYVKK